MYLIYEFENHEMLISDFELINTTSCLDDTYKLYEFCGPGNKNYNYLFEVGFAILKSKSSRNTPQLILVVNSTFTNINKHIDILLREYKLSCLLS